MVAAQADLLNVDTPGTIDVTAAAINLEGTIYDSDAGNIDLDGAVVASGLSLTLDSDADDDAGATSGNIIITGTLNGGGIAVALDADSGDAGSASSITVGGAISNASTLTVDAGAQIDVLDVATTGAQTYTSGLAGAGNIDLNGTVYDSDNGTIAFVGAVYLVGAGVAIDSDANTDGTDGDITFSSTIDGGQTLSLQADTGTVDINGAVGGATRR